MFLGIIIFWALLRAHFNPRLTARAKMSLSRAQNIFMPANINSIVLFWHSSVHRTNDPANHRTNDPSNHRTSNPSNHWSIEPRNLSDVANDINVQNTVLSDVTDDLVYSAPATQLYCCWWVVCYQTKLRSDWWAFMLKSSLSEAIGQKDTRKEMQELDSNVYKVSVRRAETDLVGALNSEIEKYQNKIEEWKKKVLKIILKSLTMCNSYI